MSDLSSIASIMIAQKNETAWTILTTEGSNTLDERIAGHRRCREELNLVSDASSSDSCSVVTLSLTDDNDTITSHRGRQASRRTRQRQNRKKQKSEQQKLTPEEQSRYVALDCEMVGVGFKGKQSALARVTIVDWNHNVVLDEYVKPDQEVSNYRTFVSGITPEILDAAHYNLSNIRTRVLEVIQDKIVVGHALKNDLKALNITHPWYLVRDTAKYEPFMKERFDDGVLWPRGLKELCKNKLKIDIQVEGKPHSPLEDAISALDLYKLSRIKWEKAMEYKMQKTRQIELQKQQPQQ